MHLPSFHAWLEHRLQEIPDATTLALVIARSGMAGVSRYDLARAVGCSSDILEGLLAALLASGQVVVVQVNGQRRYRATG